MNMSTAAGSALLNNAFMRNTSQVIDRLVSSIRHRWANRHLRLVVRSEREAVEAVDHIKQHFDLKSRGEAIAFAISLAHQHALCEEKGVRPVFIDTETLEIIDVNPMFTTHNNG